MLDKDTFFLGIDMLTTEYTDRGFIMTKEKAMQWYKYMKDIPPGEYMKKIENCLIS